MLHRLPPVRLLPPAAAVVLAACGSQTHGAYDDASEPESAGGTAVEARGGEPSKAKAAEKPRTELAFTAREDWIEEQPSSSMRVAQYRLPKVEGDGEDAELVVFHFPDSAGTVQQNFKRWARQFEQPDGGDSMEAAVFSERVVAEMPVHQMDVSGRYVAETRPGSGVRHDKPGFRLLGAIVESPFGQYYVKLTGPAATVAHWRASFESFLSEIE